MAESCDCPISLTYDLRTPSSPGIVKIGSWDEVPPSHRPPAPEVLSDRPCGTIDGGVERRWASGLRLSTLTSGVADDDVNGPPPPVPIRSTPLIECQPAETRRELTSPRTELPPAYRRPFGHMLRTPALSASSGL